MYVLVTSPGLVETLSHSFKQRLGCFVTIIKEILYLHFHVPLSTRLHCRSPIRACPHEASYNLQPEVRKTPRCVHAPPPHLSRFSARSTSPFRNPFYPPNRVSLCSFRYIEVLPSSSLFWPYICTTIISRWHSTETAHIERYERKCSHQNGWRLLLPAPTGQGRGAGPQCSLAAS